LHLFIAHGETKSLSLQTEKLYAGQKNSWEEDGGRTGVNRKQRERFEFEPYITTYRRRRHHHL
jgi:hypothetical protein